MPDIFLLPFPVKVLFTEHNPRAGIDLCLITVCSDLATTGTFLPNKYRLCNPSPNWNFRFIELPFVTILERLVLIPCIEFIHDCVLAIVIFI